MASSERPWQSYHTVFTNAKAGMDGVDKEKVQKVVYEMSKGSKYFENEQRREATVMQKIQQMHGQAALLSEADITNHEKVADIKIGTLEAERNLSRVWMHVDLDAFYAAVETLEDPSLVGKPMAVGGMSMICTANYEARKFGIRAAMPGFIACKLCADLVFIRPNFERYTLYSEKVRQVFRDYDPQFLARSLDEAYLDITDQCSLRNMTSEEIAEELRTRVHDSTGLTCSAGIGPNRMIAKVCSDINKPNGQFVVPNERLAVMTFVSTLPIRKVSGIGKVTERLLKEVLGVKVCEDLIQKGGLITALFSSISTDFFLSVGLGIGGSDVPIEESRKSLSCERTFSAISNEESLCAKLEELCEHLSKDMEDEGLQGRTLTLKLKTVKFEVRTRSSTLPMLVHKKEDLLCHAFKLLKAELPVSLRLMGLRISHFQGESLDVNQRTLADFFSADGKQGCRFSNTGRIASSCDYDDGNLQNEAPPLKPCCPESTKTRESPSLACPDFGINDVSLESPMASGSSHCSEGQGDVHTLPERMLSGDHRLLNEMKWVDDTYCSFCKLEIPSFLEDDRQEHMDFHFAQMLQQKYLNGSDLSKPFREDNKRHSSPSRKGTPPKKARGGKTESIKEKGGHHSIHAFFTRV